jgi:hypothetical protein
MDGIVKVYADCVTYTWHKYAVIPPPRTGMYLICWQRDCDLVPRVQSAFWESDVSYGVASRWCVPKDLSDRYVKYWTFLPPAPIEGERKGKK